jgi:AhpD family alkylhydroperoxidase
MSWIDVVPEGYAVMSQLEKYTRSKLDPIVLHLIKMRASMLNGCAFCLDMHAAEAVADGEDQRRLLGLAAWRETPYFTAGERAALALTDAVTRLGEHGVPDDVWDEAAAVWSEKELADLLVAIATINVWNRLSIATRTTPPLKV